MVAPSASEQYMILGLVISIFANVIILGAVFVSGVGQRVLLRYKQRFLYKRGKHVNCLLVRNNGVARTEHFVKKEPDGSFKIEGKRYIVNPLATFNYDGIPTQVNLEGTTEPIILNPENAEHGRLMATAEIEKVIQNNTLSSLEMMIKKMMPFILIFAVITVGCIIADLYFAWHVYDMLVQNNGVQAAIDYAKNATVSAVTPR